MLNNIYLGNKSDICTLLISAKIARRFRRFSQSIVCSIFVITVIPCRDTGSPNYGGSVGCNRNADFYDYYDKRDFCVGLGCDFIAFGNWDKKSAKICEICEQNSIVLYGNGPIIVSVNRKGNIKTTVYQNKRIIKDRLVKFVK